MRTGLNTASVLAGGSVYWVICIYPNATDSWVETAIGNLKLASFPGWVVPTSRLMEISDFDTSIDIIDDVIAKQASVNFTLQNVNNDIDPDTYQGRVVELRMGTGATMSIATSDVFFTGKIESADISLHSIKFQCSGKMKLWDKEIGDKLPEDVYEKDKGGIYPITHGNWTDENAYAPTVFSASMNSVPFISTQNKPIQSISSLYVFNSEANEGYRILEDSFIKNTDKTKLIPAVDTTMVTTSMISDESTNRISVGGGSYLNETIINVDDNSLITYSITSGTDVPAPCILKIDDELFQVVSIPFGSTTTILIDRGYGGTKKAYHASGSLVYQVSSDYAKSTLKINPTFYANGFSGLQDSFDTVVGRVIKYGNTVIYENNNVGQIVDAIDATQTTFLYLNYSGLGVDVSRSQTLIIFSEVMLITQLEPLTSGFWGATVQRGYAGTTAVPHIAGSVIVQSCDSLDVANSAYYWKHDNKITFAFDGVILDSNQLSSKIDVPVYNAGIRSMYITYDLIFKKTNLKANIDAMYLLIKTENASLIQGASVSPNIKISTIVSTGSTRIMTLESINSTVAPVSTSFSFNNIDGAGLENTYPVIAAVRPVDTNALTLQRFSISFNCGEEGFDKGYVYSSVSKLNQIGFRCDCSIAINENPLWVRLMGRFNPGSYFNGSLNDLIENPSSVIEDFLRTSISGIVYTDLDETSFDATYTSRAAWKLATSITAYK